MGYRSDVRVLLPEAEFNVLDEKLRALGKHEFVGYEIKKYRSESTECVKENEPEREPVRFVYFGWDYIKWHEGEGGYEYVDIVMDAVRESENCHFVRLGDDSPDFEEIYELKGYVDCIEFSREFNDDDGFDAEGNNDKEKVKTAKFVVCMDSHYVRDSQMFNMTGLSDEELDQTNIHDEENDDRWHDMEPTPFIAVIDAATEEEACSLAAKQYRYDERCLFAEKILA